MRMSDEGRRLLTKREGVRLKAYKDSVGVWTIGIGHTSAAGPPHVTPDLTITAKECDEIFRRDLKQYEDAVNEVTAQLAQHQFDACVSLCFNIGTGGFKRSTVAKRINVGDMKGAAEAFMLWNKPPEIIGRRTTEQAQFRTPYRSAPPPPDIPVPAPPVPKPDNTGRNAAGGGAVIVTTGAGGVIANEARKSGASTGEIATVIICVLVIAIAAFFIVRNWRRS